MNSLFAKIRKLQMLTPVELWVAMQAGLLLTLVAPALRYAGFRRTKQLLLLDEPQTMLACDESRIAHAQTLGRLVNGVAANLPFHSSCLVRSLVLRRLLKTRRIPSEIVIGIPLEQGDSFEAHAWVEVDATVVNDTPHVQETHRRLYQEQATAINFS